MTMPDKDSSLTLRINPIACVAHGLCAELFPEHIGLDEWGYPVLDRGPIHTALVAQAREAVAACPTLALKLNRQATQ
jgi:ferredoxin